MAIIDLTDPTVRARAIASGLVWSGPGAAQEAACKDIVEGKVPVPQYLPAAIRAHLIDLGMDPAKLASGQPVSDGAGPA